MDRMQSIKIPPLPGPLRPRPSSSGASAASRSRESSAVGGTATPRLRAIWIAVPAPVTAPDPALPLDAAPAAPLPDSPAITADAEGASRFLQSRAPSRTRDWVTLTKPEITLLVVLSSLAGYALATPAGASAVELAGLLIGVALTSAGGGVLNHVLEARFDATMHRTAQRPIPTGRIEARTAWYAGLGLIAAGVGLLCPTTNWATATLALLTVWLYLYVYTPMKRRTRWNTLVGTVPGALPALGGFVAATGWSGLAAPAAWVAFALLALWQMPHFLSLAWMYRKDYVRGGYHMPTEHDTTGTSTSWQVLGYTAAMVGVSLLPVVTNGFGWLYVAFVLALGALMLRPAVAFHREHSNASAKALLRGSVLYVMLVVPIVAAFAWA